MNRGRFYQRPAFLIGLLAAFLLPTVSLHAHGGKQHGAVEFTHLEAVRKATDLFEKLIATKKIDSDWEVNLEQVRVFDRRKGDKTELGVSFTRSTGDPKVLYIFFTSQGEYTGSNFTGD
jgi:hypothetical protein